MIFVIELEKNYLYLPRVKPECSNYISLYFHE